MKSKLRRGANRWRAPKLNQCPEIETIFLTPREEYTYVSSSVTKEIARLGGDISSLVPDSVATALSGKFS